VNAALDDRAQARRAADAAENGERRSGGDAAGAGHDHDRDGVAASLAPFRMGWAAVSSRPAQPNFSAEPLSTPSNLSSC